jgi:hypothetical protein
VASKEGQVYLDLVLVRAHRKVLVVQEDRQAVGDIKSLGLGCMNAPPQGFLIGHASQLIEYILPAFWAAISFGDNVRSRDRN